MPSNDNDSSLVKSAERTMRILETLAASPAPLSLSELQTIMGYPRSSLYSLVRTLSQLRWVEADSKGTAFGIGPNALSACAAYLDHDPAIPHVYRALEDLRSEVGHSVHYGRLQEGHLLVLASRESRDRGRNLPSTRRRIPAYSTAPGLALLAELTAPEVDEALAAPGLEPIGDRLALHTKLARVHDLGWAHKQETGTETVAVAVPYRIPATDAISCILPTGLATAREVTRVASATVQSAAELAATLRRHGIR